MSGIKPRRQAQLQQRAPIRRGERPRIALGALDTHLGYFIRRLQVWIFSDFIRTLSAIDISPAQYSVLTVIGSNAGLSQSELADALSIERARLVRVLHKLDARGLTRRVPSAADKRAHALRLTVEGQKILLHARKLAGRHEARLIKMLGTESHALLLRSLRESSAAY
jgi:DNA-binding MarR family transcriptional regulator